jgi:hypothetical protein
VRVDRGSRPPVDLQNPALTIVLSPQPDVLHGLAEHRSFRGRGLLARFLWLLPISNLGCRTGQARPAPAKVSEAYDKGMRALLMMGRPPGEPPAVIKLTPGALEEWREFSQAVEKDLREDGKFEHLRDWAGKLPGLAARIAGLIHCAEYAFDSPVRNSLNLDTMQRAIDLATVGAAHALAAFDLMGADLALKAARKLWSWIERERTPQFTFKQAFDALRGSYPRAADLEPAVEVLVERYFIEEQPRSTTAGRPSRVFKVNPALTEKWKER